MQSLVRWNWWGVGMQYFGARGTMYFQLLFSRRYDTIDKVASYHNTCWKRLATARTACSASSHTGSERSRTDLPSRCARSPAK